MWPQRNHHLSEIAEPLALLSPYVFLTYVQMNKQRTNNSRKQAPRRKKRTRRAPKQSNALIMPPKLIRTLRYVDSAYVRNNPGNSFLVYSFRINDLYDPDPLILSGSISGFKEIMQFYSFYRVLHVAATVTISNLESFPLMYGMVFSQSNLTGTIVTRDDAMNALEDPFSSRAKLLSGKGGMDRAQISKGISCARILGIRSQYMSEANYAGQGLSTPTTPLWLNFIVASGTGGSLANGYCTTTTLTFHSEFFGLLNLRS